MAVQASPAAPRCLGISKGVESLGEQDQTLPLPSIADLFLLPSDHESFGLSALDTMACEALRRQLGQHPRGPRGAVSARGDSPSVFNDLTCPRWESARQFAQQ